MAILPTRADWCIERYTSTVIRCQVLVEGGNTPYDLTNHAIKWVAGTAPTIEKTLAAATITILGLATNGTFEFEITAAESLLLPSGTSAAAIAHQCKIEDQATLRVYNVFEGTIRVDSTLIEAI